MINAQTGEFPDGGERVLVFLKKHGKLTYTIAEYVRKFSVPAKDIENGYVDVSKNGVRYAKPGWYESPLEGASGCQLSNVLYWTSVEEMK